MPYKSQKIKIQGTQYDRRRKLSDDDRAKIPELAKTMSIRGIARMFGVDNRLIQFILYPERHEKNLADRKERGGSAIYYDKTKQTKSIREHRRYKQELYKKGLIK